MPFRSVRSRGLFPGDDDPPAPRTALTAFIDGGARGNPGPAGYGVHVEDAEGKTVAELSEYLGRQTNNVAEYSGLIAALDYAVKHGHTALKIVSDSELLVKQIKGAYKVKSPDLKPLYEQARTLIRKLGHFEIRHVLRAQNKHADRLANAAMDKGTGRAPTAAAGSGPKEYSGIVRGGVIELFSADLPEGTRVRVKVVK